ncbi:hypothetical protein ACET3Z_022474 [Daucus carota]
MCHKIGNRLDESLFHRRTLQLVGKLLVYIGHCFCFVHLPDASCILHQVSNRRHSSSPSLTLFATTLRV